MKLHIGSGVYYWPGWVNVDRYSDADVPADADSLPFDSDSVEEIQAIHVFEHIPRLGIPAVLAEWRRVLVTGGRLVLEMPSMDKIARMIVDGERDLRMTLLGIFGDPSDPLPGMLHAWCWTDAELIATLEQSGFRDAQISEPTYHLARRDFRAVAYARD